MKKFWLAAAVFFVLGLSSNASAVQYTFTTIDFPGATDTFANGINDQGSIVGTNTTDNTLIHLWGKGADGDQGFLYEGGTFTTVNFPSAVATKVTDINNSGTMVGTAFEQQASILFGTGFSFDGGNFKPVQFSEAVQFGTSLNGISNSGLMVGSFDDGATNRNFVIDENNVTKLSDVFGDDSSANDINNKDLIVGDFLTPADVDRGFTFVGDTLTELSFPGSDSTFANSVNDLDLIVGSFVRFEEDGGFEEHGYFFEDGNYFQIDFPGAEGTTIRGINNSGDIVGAYLDGSGWHGFLASRTASQVPEPATMALLGMTLGGVALLRRKAVKNQL